MRYLVETDRIVDWLNGQADARELLSTLSSEGLWTSLISYGEIYEGIHYGRDPSARLNALRRFLRVAPLISLVESIMERFARERGFLRRQGTPIADMDLLIAATALEHGLTLVTRNLRHYQRTSADSESTHKSRTRP